MSLLPLSSLLTKSGRDDMLAALLDIATSVQLATTSWVEGDPLLTLLLTVSQKFADFSALVVDITKGGFGDLLPSDAWADLWAQSRFNVQRVPDTEATGLVNCANTENQQYDLAIGELIVAHAVTGKTYRNKFPISILALVGLDDIVIVADEPGTASNAAPDEITDVVSSLVGVSCTNPLAVLGTDKEKTPALVKRARSKLGSFSPNGPKDAYNYVATSPELSATSIPITRTKTVLDPLTGELAVYLATAEGPATAPDVAIVQAAIDANVEPWGTTATAFAATAHVFDITYQAWVRGSQLTVAQLQTVIAQALAVYFAEVELGGDVIPPDPGSIYVQSLEQVIGHATDGVTRVIVSIPATTTPLTPNIVAQLGTITPTITVL